MFGYVFAREEAVNVVDAQMDCFRDELKVLGEFNDPVNEAGRAGE